MRRAVIALFGTMLGTSLMIGAKLGTHTEGNVLLGEPGETAPSGDPVAADPSAAPTGPAASLALGRTPGPGTTTGAPTPRPPASSAPPGGGGGGLKNGTFPGTSVSEKYGTVKVTIVVSGGRITDVTATYPTGGETGSINAKAIPKLRSEALAAQSASIATVSGATYTSGAYKTSLQAAINAAKA